MQHDCIIPDKKDADVDGTFLFCIMLILGVLFVTFYFGLPALRGVLPIKPNPQAVTLTNH